MTQELLLIGLAAAEKTAGYGSAPIWQDTTFWVSLSMLIVIGLFAYLGVHKSIAKGLDSRAQKIADELDQARRLREEAQELLAKYQRRQREAEEEAQGIIDQAKRDAKRLAEESRSRIAEQIERRAKAAEHKIARAEAQAIAEVRGETAEVAVEAARSIIRSRMDDSAHTALAEKAIGDLKAKLH